MEGLRVVIVEDEALIAEAVGDQLGKAGCRVLATISTGRAAVEAAATLDPDVILMDIRLHGNCDGIRAAELIQLQRPLPVVFVTANSDFATQQRARAAGAIGFLPKPFDLEGFRVVIKAARARRQLRRRKT